MGQDIGEVSYQKYEAQKFEIRQTTEKSINSLYERNVITAAQKEQLLHKYLNGEISFGDDGLTAEEASHFTAEDMQEIDNTLATNNKVKDKTLYIIQAGDTPEVIAEKMGFSGVEAKNFATSVKAAAIKSGVYYSYGFKTGDMIQLNGNFSQQIETLRQNGEYYETIDEINNSYKNKRKAQRTERTQNTPKSQPSRNTTTRAERNKENAQKVYTEASEIVKALEGKASYDNRVLQKINSRNVVFVMKMYYDRNGRHLSRDLLNNGDKKCMAIYNTLCHNLCARAQELDVPGVYFKDASNCIGKPAEMMKWLNGAYPKMLNAEKKNNPAFNDAEMYKNALQGKNKIQAAKRVDTSQVRKDAKKLSDELHEALTDSYNGGIRQKLSNIWANKDNSVTKSILKKISTDNVAFVVQQYKADHNKSLAEAIGEEWIGLDINDVKNEICKKLVAQAKKLGLTGIYHSSYRNETDIKKLSAWIDSVSAKIVNAMDSTSVKRVNEQKTETARKGGGKYVTITNGAKFKEAGITKAVEEYDASGKKLSTHYYYKDGKVVKEYEDKEKSLIRKLVKPGKTTKSNNTSNISEPVPMRIKLPPNANDGAKKFAKALEENKAKIMKVLKIDNDTYNKLAKLAMAIAEQETNFGNPGAFSVGGAKYGVAGVDSITGGVVNKVRKLSFGPTQIKFNKHVKDADVKAAWEAFGIKTGIQLYDLENSAIATMVLLAVLNRRVHGEKAQQGIQAANGRVIENQGWEEKNGTLVKSYNTKPYVNNVTDEDAICYYWNTGGKAVRDGTADPLGNPYTRNVRQYIKKYETEEKPADRAKAIEKSRSKQAVRNYKPMDNNGPMGAVIFMPKMYAGNLCNKQQEIQILEESLKKNNRVNSESKKLLLQAVKNGEIAFDYGLKASEADSLTQRDVDMLLNHIRKIKQTIEAKDSSIKFSDGIDSTEAQKLGNKYQDLIRRAELNFKREYLNSKSPVVSISSVDKSSVVQTPMNNDFNVGKMHQSSNQRRGFVGYNQDKGVNPNNTSAASRALAQSAKKTANSMRTARQCMTGFRRAMLDAGVDAASSKDLVEGTPRATVGWFERHPDMFEEVKWINIGNGNARQINSTDLPKLPAGYIVVWIPSNPKFEGHISITNGNGEAYADETDNLNWGDYRGKETDKGTGKGEHGTFRVFRLTDKWEVDPATGKLKFCK